MAAESMESVQVTWNGLSGDRRWAFVRDEAAHGGFPWLTLRQRRDMWEYHPAFEDPTNPDSSPTVVRTPTGGVVDVRDPGLAEELHPPGARLIRLDRGAFDAFPVSLISVQTVARLGEMVDQELDPLRFRPNLLIDLTSQDPFEEDAWLGCVVRVGGVRMRFDKRDGRCVVITIDPETGEKTPAVLRAVAEHREGCLGVYGSTVTQGRLTVGDDVILEPH